MKLEQKDFDVLKEYIHQICGIVIQPEKKYLVRQRIEPLVQAYGFKNFYEFCKSLVRHNPVSIRDEIISAIVTNETYFFRDTHPFETFKNYLLPRMEQLVQERTNQPHHQKEHKVRIWSAGSSTGQEAYSLAMIIDEYIQSNPSAPINVEDFSIVASDISNIVLTKAISGEYNNAEITRGLPAELKSRYFKQVGENWHLDSCILKMVQYNRINLIESFIMLGKFDVIFCRNVLIYFNAETKQKIIDQFHHMLQPKGYLIVGATENLYGLTNKFNSFKHENTHLYFKDD